MAGVFSGKVAVVTGASGGIGSELARQLAAAAARIGFLARRPAPLEYLAASIRATGGIAVAALADVTDRHQVEHALEALRGALGPLDMVIASAGVGMPSLLDPVNVADVEAMIRVNLLGVVYSFAAVLPEMLRRRSGRLAAVSSLSAYFSLPEESGYCASKAAVNVYLDGLRAHVSGRGVQVTTLRPGFAQTQMTQENTFWMPGLLSAREAARRMLTAIGRGRKVYNFPLAPVVLTNVLRVMPDWASARLMAGYNERALRRYGPG